MLSNVSRPHAWYPTPSNSWQSQLLRQEKQVDRDVNNTSREEQGGVRQNESGDMLQVACEPRNRIVSILGILNSLNKSAHIVLRYYPN
ncbi:hypothetical protein Syun_023663 [Stephania yunnanensis]|uniref:Uncharacterized protein n=1 Tax=Stephania yunnanensis TaxID=152371 RepID=A0AAP0I2E4_9MAGN